jgi:hypothetical protein
MMHIYGATPLTVVGLLIIIIFYSFLVVLDFTKKSYLRTFENPGMVLAIEDLEVYAGSYFSEQLNMTMKVWVENARLTAQIVGQISFVLTPVKKDIFNYLPFQAVLEFYPERNELVLIQYGKYMPFIKR